MERHNQTFGNKVWQEGYKMQKQMFLEDKWKPTFGANQLKTEDLNF